LTSAAGAKLNGTIGTVAGKRHEVNGRFPITLVHSITGIKEIKAIKPVNLNLFVAQNGTEEEEEIMSIVSYTKTSKLRTAHGMILDQILTLARWESNIICGNKLANNYEAFTRIPRNHPEMPRLNSLTFTYWHTSPALAGYHGVEKPLFDLTVEALAVRNTDKMESGWTQWKIRGPKFRPIHAVLGKRTNHWRVLGHESSSHWDHHGFKTRARIGSCVSRQGYGLCDWRFVPFVTMLCNCHITSCI
jgi:hypothetical protein